VGGKVRGAVVDPEARVVTHTLVPRSQRHASDVEPARAAGDERTPLPTTALRLTAGVRVRLGSATVGQVTCLWADRLSASLTHVLVRPRVGVFRQGPERILPLELVETISETSFHVSKGVLSLAELPLYRNDALIARDVRLALAEAVPDPQARRAIKARVEDGQIFLTGNVETPEVVAAAQSAVAHLPGVRGVTVDVVPLETLADRVEEQVNRVIAERQIMGAQVRILTEHGIVYLEGCAPSPEARAQIERAALSAAGARVVVNDIAVNGEPPSRATQTGPLVRNR
jgi:osmotically-inducible protein OsmY